MTTYRYTFTVDIEDPTAELIAELCDGLKVYGEYSIDFGVPTDPATHADVIQSHTDLDGRLEGLSADLKRAISTVTDSHAHLDGRLAAIENWMQSMGWQETDALKMENAGLRGERDREKERADTLANRLESRDQR